MEARKEQVVMGGEGNGAGRGGVKGGRAGTTAPPRSTESLPSTSKGKNQQNSSNSPKKDEEMGKSGRDLGELEAGEVAREAVEVDKR